MPIDATKGFSADGARNRDPAGMLDPIAARRSGAGFSSKPAICPSRSNRKTPIEEASSAVTGWAAIVMSACRSIWESIRSW